jgi:ABC-type branched-subunit amino acid transport system ATPase component
MTQDPLVRADGLGLRTRRGWVFRGVDLALAAGSVIALAGEAGSGRSMLLLALAGRARPTAGTLTVAGEGHRAHIRRSVAVARITASIELELELRVADHVREAALLANGDFDYRWARRLVSSAVDSTAQRVGSLVRTAELTTRAGESTPQGVDSTAQAGESTSQGVDPGACGDDWGGVLEADSTTLAGDLAPDESVLLSVALALATRPLLLVVDDVDFRASAEQQARIWRALRTVADNGTTVVASTVDTDIAAAAGATVVQIGGSRR